MLKKKVLISSATFTFSLS